MFSFNLWTSSNWTLNFTCFSDRPKLPFHLVVVTGAMPDGCKGLALNSDPPIPTWRIIPVVNNHGRLVSPHKDRVVGPPSLHGHSHGLSMTGFPTETGMILQVFQAFSWVFQPLSCWSLEVKTLPPEPAKEKEEPKKAASNWFSWRHGNGREIAELKNGKSFSFFLGGFKEIHTTPMFLVWSRNPFQHDFYKAGGRLDPLFYESGCKMWYTPRNFHTATVNDAIFFRSRFPYTSSSRIHFHERWRLQLPRRTDRVRDEMRIGGNRYLLILVDW